MNLSDMVKLRNNDLHQAGLGIQRLAELLGADGSDHGLSATEEQGLTQALEALGALVENIAGDYFEAANPE